MLPATLLGLVLLMAVIAPGYTYMRIAERRGVRPDRSALVETAEFVVTGTISSVCAVGAVLLAGSLLDEFFLDLSAWARGGSAYLRVSAPAAARSAGAAFVASLAMGATLALVVHRGRPKSFHPEGTVWGDVFERAARGRSVFVTVLLKSGEVVEGYRLSSGNTLEEQRDLALAGPIFFTEPRSPRLRLENVDATVLPAAEIRRIGVRYEQH